MENLNNSLISSDSIEIKQDDKDKEKQSPLSISKLTSVTNTSEYQKRN